MHPVQPSVYTGQLWNQPRMDPNGSETGPSCLFAGPVLDAFANVPDRFQNSSMYIVNRSLSAWFDWEHFWSSPV